MLVLSRRVGERLVIGDNIVVTVIEVRSDGVRLGIDAPRDVRVHRAEILEAVTAANVEASAVVDDAAVAALRDLVHRPRPSTATGEDSASEDPGAQDPAGQGTDAPAQG